MTTTSSHRDRAAELLTTKQAAERMNVSDHTLRYWGHRGEGPPAVKLGNLVRYDADQLEEWIAARYEVSA